MSDKDRRVVIRVEHLKKYYNDHTIHALDDVSMEIRQGEVVCIIGPSGSGKSTLMNIIGCLDTPTSGDATATRSSTPPRGGTATGTRTASSWPWTAS